MRKRGRIVDIVPRRHVDHRQPDLARTIQGSRVHRAGAPANVLEQPAMRLRQADQRIAAVERRAQDDVVGPPNGIDGRAQDRPRQGRAVGIHQQDAIVVGVQQILDAAEQPIAEIAVDLRHQPEAGRQQPPQAFLRSDGRIDGVARDVAIFGQPGDGLRKIADEARRQSRALFRTQRRRQPRLRFSRRRCLAHDADGNACPCRCSLTSQGLDEIEEQVVDILEADRQAQQVRRTGRPGALDRRPMLDQAFNAAERRRALPQPRPGPRRRPPRARRPSRGSTACRRTRRSSGGWQPDGRHGFCRPG